MLDVDHQNAEVSKSYQHFQSGSDSESQRVIGDATLAPLVARKRAGASVYPSPHPEVIVFILSYLFKVERTQLRSFTNKYILFVAQGLFANDTLEPAHPQSMPVRVTLQCTVLIREIFHT
jgi:hypothetical protein